MIEFLLKGLLRDRHRSLFPVLVIAGGVMITVLTYCYLLGFEDDLIRNNAKLNTGHLKVTTRGYAENADQSPNDLALSNVSRLIAELRRDYPELDWVARIRFGGLLDIPDSSGETRSQGPVYGVGLALLRNGSTEVKRLNLEDALARGRLPDSPGEIILSDRFAEKLGVEIGESATLISSTADGSMAVQNFIVAGTIRFGIGPLDRNAMLADISDIRYALAMEDQAGEILGYFPDLIYDKSAAAEIAEDFNRRHGVSGDDFSPVMQTLEEQNGLGELLDYTHREMLLIITIFIVVMSIVLWNAGLLSGLRRYREMGIRLALGESKGHVYWSLVHESILIGFVGSVLGAAVGLGVSYYLQKVGLDISGMMRGNTMLISNVIRARVTTAGYFIGFIPGMVATVLGTGISGIGIFKRQTAQLFKELEA